MTSIEWVKNTDGSQGKTWNPIVGCSVVSPGCTNCYAMKMAARLERMRQAQYTGLTRPTKAGPVWTGEMRLVEKALTLPLRTRKPTTWFVNSMSDLFHEGVPDAWIDRVFAVMALAPHHTFQVLTKRSARMRAYMAGCENPPDDLPLSKPWVTQWHRRDQVANAMGQFDPRLSGQLGKVRQLPLPNVWLGVSAEDQRRADERVPDLLATPAAVRFVSAEPLLGPIDFRSIDVDGDSYVTPLTAHSAEELSQEWGELSPAQPRLDWIIVGCESGAGARPMQEGWVLDIVEQCRPAGVACFVKQLSGPKGRAVKDMAAFPATLRVRDMPEVRL